MTGRTLSATTKQKISAALKASPRFAAHLARLHSLPLSPRQLAHVTALGYASKGRKQKPATAAYRLLKAQQSRDRWQAATKEERAHHRDIGRRAWARMTPEQRIARVGLMQMASQIYHRPTMLQQSIAAVLVAMGVRHSEQYRVARYIVDFYLPDHGLVVECDGQHWHETQAALQRDAERDKAMRALGYSVLRLPEKMIRSGDAATTLRARLESSSAC